MDLYCPICAEPFDVDTLHDEAEDLDSTFAEIQADFYKRGCEALGRRHNAPASTETSAAISMIYELLGDDVDGAAVELDDFIALGGFQ